MERGFQHDELRTYLVEQFFFFFAVINADQFLVEGNRQRRLAAESRHFLPLPGANGLLDAVNVVSGEQFQFLQRLLRGECAVGVYAQRDALLAETGAEAADKVELGGEIYRPDFKFHA